VSPEQPRETGADAVLLAMTGKLGAGDEIEYGNLILRRMNSAAGLWKVYHTRVEEACSLDIVNFENVHSLASIVDYLERDLGAYEDLDNLPGSELLGAEEREDASVHSLDHSTRGEADE
jgi:hypothetical protein